MSQIEPERLALLQERIAVAENVGKAAHARLDHIDEVWREQNKALTDKMDAMPDKIKESLRDTLQKVAEFDGFMNRGKGWAAAALLLSGILGGLLAKIVWK